MGYNYPVGVTLGEQIKSKKRVSDHGEVFTSEREVNAMLDLVKQETERIDSRFLEPACGTGNFLEAILRRKLAIVRSRYSRNQLEYELYALTAVASLYGIDILQDNVLACRDRLFQVFDEEYEEIYKTRQKEQMCGAVRFVLSRNILWGDALSLKEPTEEAKPIIFSEWSVIEEGKIKRRDYTLANLLENRMPEAETLFSDLGDKAFIPKPIASFPPVYFLEVGKHVTN